MSNVEIRIPEDPLVCGATGCTNTDNLLEVETQRGTRILCPPHVRGWVERALADETDRNRVSA